jgi:hypothetical protein
MDDRTLLRGVADRLEHLARRSTAGDWRIGGLLASRPEVIAHAPDGATEHVAEARAASAGWIAAVSPAAAAPLAAWLRHAADADPVPEPARAFAHVLDERLP